MVQKKLCIVLNMASHYRKEIYEKIDSTFDCDFHVGEAVADIKSLEMSHFRNPVNYYSCIKNKKTIIWQKNILRLVFSRKYDAYIVSEDIRCISSWLFAFLGKLLGKKIIAWTHGWYGKETFLQKTVKKIFYRLFYRVLLYGDRAKELMVDEGFKEGKLIVIHNSLAYSAQLSIRKSLQPSPLYQQHFSNEGKIILFVGRLTKIKKLDLILKAVSKAKIKGKCYNVVFIGGGEEEKSLKDIAKQLTLENQVWFYGPCYDEKTLANLIFNADICVSPGNVGLTAIHSMTFGTPVITNNDFEHQMPEFETIISGKTGDFFDEGDVDSLFLTLEKWFSRPSYNRQIIRENCYNVIDKSWTPHFMLSRIEEAIN